VAVPIIGTKQADTTLQVNSGQTIVIGGLLENNLNRDALRKLPWLADIPLFGYLFRHRERESEQREVLFFMTPSVVKDIDAVTANAPSSPLMREWNRTKAIDNVLPIPGKDEPTLSLKGPPEEPKEPEMPRNEPNTNYGPARPAQR
jgi:type II secretory pathway component GspD/PulD (secretin)